MYRRVRIIHRVNEFTVRLFLQRTKKWIVHNESTSWILHFLETAALNFQSNARQLMRSFGTKKIPCFVGRYLIDQLNRSTNYFSGRMALEASFYVSFSDSSRWIPYRNLHTSIRKYHYLKYRVVKGKHYLVIKG